MIAADKDKQMLKATRWLLSELKKTDVRDKKEGYLTEEDIKDKFNVDNN